MSQMVDDIGDVIIEDLPKMLLEKGKGPATSERQQYIDRTKYPCGFDSRFSERDLTGSRFGPMANMVWYSGCTGRSQGTWQSIWQLEFFFAYNVLRVKGGMRDV